MSPLPTLAYGRQVIDGDDIAAVNKVLEGDWLTTGPAVDQFEAALAHEVGAKHATVCNSGTAALYMAARAAGLRPGDAVIVPAITFVATASANILAGLEVVFADVNSETGLMGVDEVDSALRRAGKDKVKAIFPVHLAGRVSEPEALAIFAHDHALHVIEDACHALGTRYGNAGHRVGACESSLMACFSFHPVKTIAMGEGGAVTTNNPDLAARLKHLRNHGMNRDVREMLNSELAFSEGEPNPWYYEVSEPSHNFRASDINCALGLSQLKKLRSFLFAREALMAHYSTRLASLAPLVRLAPLLPGVEPGWHLCSILVDFDRVGMKRHKLMAELKARGIGTQVHYIPVHLQPFYRERYGRIDLPGAETYYSRTLSLPLYASMTKSDVDRVADALSDIFAGRAIL